MSSRQVKKLQEQQAAEKRAKEEAEKKRLAAVKEGEDGGGGEDDDESSEEEVPDIGAGQRKGGFGFGGLMGDSSSEDILHAVEPPSFRPRRLVPPYTSLDAMATVCAGEGKDCGDDDDEDDDDDLL